VLWSKRLENERFIWPKISAEDAVSMTGEQLNRLLDGFDVRAQRHCALALRVLNSNKYGPSRVRLVWRTAAAPQHGPSRP